MWIGGDSRSEAIPSAEELSKYLNCKLLMPFENDISDHSIYSRNVTKTGVTLDEGGAVFNGSSSYLSFPKPIENWSDNWTIEILFKCGVLTTLNMLMDIRNSAGYGFWIQIPANNSVGIYLSDGSTVKSLKLTYDSDIFNHIALVKNGNVFSVYKNGELIQSIEDARTLNFNSTWCVGRVNTIPGNYLKGIIGGIKITKGVLEPQEFCLTRPFKIPEINFKEGNKIYLFKDGIWNNDFERKTHGVVTMNDDGIHLGVSSLIGTEIPENYFGKHVYFEYKPTVGDSNNDVNSRYFISTAETADGSLANFNYTQRIVDASYNRLQSLVNHTSGLIIINGLIQIETHAGQQIDIFKIWIE